MHRLPPLVELIWTLAMGTPARNPGLALGGFRVIRSLAPREHPRHRHWPSVHDPNRAVLDLELLTLIPHLTCSCPCSPAKSNRYLSKQGLSSDRSNVEGSAVEVRSPLDPPPTSRPFGGAAQPAHQADPGP